MKKLFALLFLALVAACAHDNGPSLYPPEGADVAQKTLDATVKIELPYGHGSGFFVAPGVVLTAAHVVDDVVEAPEVRTRSGRSCGFERGESLVGHDAALLWVSGCDDVPHLLIGPAPQEGAEVWLAGAPLEAEWSITRGIVTDADHVTFFGQMLILDAVAHPGMSGGPAVDYRGQAVGITVRIMTLGGGSWVGKSFAVPLSTILEDLGENGVPLFLNE